MGKREGFSALIDEVKRRPLKIDGRCRHNKTYNFIQYCMRYDGESLHYEIVDGYEGRRLKGDDNKPLYEIDVAYLELHFEERRGMRELEKRRIRFFASRLSTLSTPFRFIPQWGGSGAGFALRYAVTDDHLGGVPCSAGTEMSKVRDEIEKRMCEFIKELDPEIERLINQFDEEEKNMAMIVEWTKKLQAAKQIILTGAPGTGKTYLARQIARSMVLSEKEKKMPKDEIEKLIKSRTKFVQFHPSYDYTDFVEGLRPIQGIDGQVGFKRQDGAFKKLCKAAIATEQCGGADNFEEVWTKFIAFLEERHSQDNPLELTTPDKKCKFKVFANRRSNLSLITSGKDKVQGSLTKANVRKYYVSALGDNDDYWSGYFKGVLSYLEDKKNGYCLKSYLPGTAVAPADRQKFVMIIDEINRGDISKIFGELFYAIDDGYRGPKGRVDTQYQNLVEDSDPFFEGFYVPENVYIIGTMNDIDRNVESMDFAIRRRFTWEEIDPKERFDAMMTGLKDYSGTAVPEEIIKQARERMDGLNSAIRNKEHGLGSAYQIGPSYFMKIADYAGDANVRFEALWVHHLKPLLMEYLRGMPNADDTIDKKLKPAYDHGTKDNTESVQAAAG